MPGVCVCVIANVRAVLYIFLSSCGLETRWCNLAAGVWLLNRKCTGKDEDGKKIISLCLDSASVYSMFVCVFLEMNVNICVCVRVCCVFLFVCICLCECA